MTAVGVVAGHPPWCDEERCPRRFLASGMPHQSRELAVVVAGQRVAGVVLIQHERGPVQVAVHPAEWPPGVAVQVAEAVVEVSGWVRG